MELEVVSTHPRAYIVDRFLSDHETDEIIKLARPGMTESQVGEETKTYLSLIYNLKLVLVISYCNFAYENFIWIGFILFLIFHYVSCHFFTLDIKFCGMSYDQMIVLLLLCVCALFHYCTV